MEEQIEDRRKVNQKNGGLLKIEKNVEKRGKRKKKSDYGYCPLQSQLTCRESADSIKKQE